MSVRTPSFLPAAVSILAASLYVVAHLPTGWYPHDEGQLAQAAERILEGDIPHRDFDDMYTGGLSYLHALAFKCLGIRCIAMRVMLGIFFLPAAMAIYALARRVVSPWIAGLVTLLGAMVSVPVYSASMPSWYNLFFALFGVVALVRFIETDHRRWVFLAGLCGGISILFKISGLFFVAAGLLFFIYREQLIGQEKLAAQADDSVTGSPRSRGYSWFILAGLSLFGLISLAFLGKNWPAINALHFSLPMLALAMFLLVRELELQKSPVPGRWGRLLGMIGPFCLGVGLPLLGLVAFYASHGALADLYRGVFVLPRLRMERGAFPLPDFKYFLIAVPLGGLLALGIFQKGISRWLEFAIVIGLFALFLGSWTEPGFLLGFHAFRNLLPLVVGITLGMLAWADPLKISNQRRQELFLICATALLVSLVQYPYGYSLYFFYAAPLVVLLVVYLVMNSASPPRIALLGLLLYYLAFSAIHLNGPDPPFNVAWGATPRNLEPSQIDRCGLVIPTSDAASYRELIAEIEAHSAPGSYILATPDCPEVYFLANRKNVSGVMYEFFRPGRFASQQNLFDELDRHDVQVVVIHCMANFSDPMSQELEAAIAERFPNVQTISLDVPRLQKRIDRFRVYWRDSSKPQRKE